MPAMSSTHEAAVTTAVVTYALPAEPLRAAITTYYLVKVSGPGTVRDQIFPEWPNFRLLLSGAWKIQLPDAGVEPLLAAGVTGALERASWVEGSAGLIVGVGLMPQGWPRLTDQPADEFTNVMRPLADAIGPVADTLFARLKAAEFDGDDALYRILDEVFLSLLNDAPEADLVATAHTALQDPGLQTVSDWAETVGVSSRQLERFSLRYLGLSPKRLLRRQRVLRTLAAMRDSPQGTWSQWIDDQFTDQAHFIHEFNYYMGVTPGAYLARNQPIMAGAWKNRKALLGSPVQVLQPPSRRRV